MRRRDPTAARTGLSLRVPLMVAVSSLGLFLTPLVAWVGVLFTLCVLAVLTLWIVMEARLLKRSDGLAVARTVDPVLSLGTPNLVRLTLSHSAPTALDVEVLDEPPLDFTGDPGALRLKAEPRRTYTVDYHVTPVKRGDYQFGNLHVRVRCGMGMLVRTRIVPASRLVKVYPNVQQNRSLMLLARAQRMNAMGLRRMKQLGQGMEFNALRDYVPDDPLRTVDWKATARRGSLITREYDVERNQTVILALDLGRTMASMTSEGITKADTAINACMLLSHVALEHDDRVGLFCYAARPIAWTPPGKGAGHIARIADTLYPLLPRVEESDTRTALTLLAHKQTKRSMVFLFTDLIDPVSSRALLTDVGMLARKHLVVCVALSDYELPQLLEREPQRPEDLYEQTVAMEIQRDRRAALAALEALHVVTIEATPANLTVQTVNRYLRLKREGRL